MEICSLSLDSRTLDFEGWVEPQYTEEEKSKVEAFFQIEGDKCFDNPMEIVEMCLDVMLPECRMLLLYDSENNIVGVVTAVIVADSDESHWEVQVHMLSDYMQDWKEYFDSVSIRDWEDSSLC